MSETPNEFLIRGKEMAEIISDVVKHQPEMSVKIQGKQHLVYEIWQMLAAYHGYFPVVEWTRPIVNADRISGWESRVIVVNSNGETVSAAESMCMAEEVISKQKNITWGDRDEHARRSMSQTRTAGKAIRMILAWIAVLAGFAPTPAEEMDGVERGEPAKPAQQPATAKPAASVPSGAVTEELLGTALGFGKHKAETWGVLGDDFNKDGSDGDGRGYLKWLGAQVDDKTGKPSERNDLARAVYDHYDLKPAADDPASKELPQGDGDTMTLQQHKAIENLAKKHDLTKALSAIGKTMEDLDDNKVSQQDAEKLIMAMQDSDIADDDIPF